MHDDASTRLKALKLRHTMLNEAAGREAHADEMSQLALYAAQADAGSTLRRMAHAQRIRAMELRGLAAVLAAGDTAPTGFE